MATPAKQKINRSAVYVSALRVIIGLVALSVSNRAATIAQKAYDDSNSEPLVVTFPNAAIYLSPYTWRVFSGSIDAPTGGAYFKGVVSSTTSIVANVDTSGNAGQAETGMPSFKVTIDDGPASYVQEAIGATQVTLAAGLGTGSHRYLVQVIGAATGVGNSWAGLLAHTVINSLQFTAGATLSPPAVRPNVCLALGDSYLQTVLGTAGSPFYNAADYTVSWPQWVAAALNCEIGQIGIGGTAWSNNSSTDGYPTFPNWWNFYDSAHARDLAIVPNYLLVGIGVNDHVGAVSTSQIDTAMNAWHAAVRSTAGWATVPLFLVLPNYADVSDAANHAQIAATAAAWGDDNVHAIDVGHELQTCLPFINSATSCSLDGFHPDVAHHGWLAAQISAAIQKALDDPQAIVQYSRQNRNAY